MRAACGLGVTVLASLAVMVSGARAATWMEISCENPNGSVAPSQGWSSEVVGSPEGGSQASVACDPGAPMTASLDAGTPAPGGAKEALEYQPPVGSSLVGGQIDVRLSAASIGQNAAGAAALYEPALADDQNDAFLVCSPILQPCQGSTDTYTGVVSLPGARGGDLFANAECAGASGTYCTSGAQDGTWASAQVYWAHALLATSAIPQASGFAGSALQRGASGTAHIVLTATDTGGPGIYQATVGVDGRTVYAGTPNANGGACAPVGADAATGALMYDASQPCPASEVLDLPVPTDGLPDGPHELSVGLTDAAGTTSPVLDQTITTSNPQMTPAPRGRHSVRARFVISWSWSGPHTVLRSIRVGHLPRDARVTVGCRGRGCPKLHLYAVSARRIVRLLRALAGKRLRAGDIVRITVTAPHSRAERIELRVRDGAEPQARLARVSGVA